MSDIRYRMSDIDIGRRISYLTSDIISDYTSVEGHAVAVIVSQTAPHRVAYGRAEGRDSWSCKRIYSVRKLVK